jgi:hypothetical protein
MQKSLATQQHASDLPLRVYIPRDGTTARAAIAEQSGVVGSPVEGGRVLLDYEANLYGAVNLKTFADKIHHAAGRHRVRYPTRARTEVDEAAVIDVGLYDGERVILDAERREAVANWLGLDPGALDSECERSDRRSDGMSVTGD